MIKYLLAFLFVTSTAQAQISYSAPKISSGTFGGRTVTSQTVVALPPQKLNCRASITYTNLSSTEDVHIAPSMTVPSSALMISSATVIFQRSHISIDVDPLSDYPTFYFLAPAGSTGVDVRWIDLGCPGAFD